MQITASVNADNVRAYLDGIAKQVPVAQKNALQAALGVLRDDVLNAVKSDGQLPLNVLANRLRFDDKPDAIALWLGQLPVNAAYLGAISQGGTGGYAGKQFFQGAFVITKGGYQTLRKRTGQGRLPIEAVTAEVGDWQAVADNSANLAVNQYVEVFLQDVEL